MGVINRSFADGDKMSLSQTIIFGMIFPLMFCSIGSLFARKGYVYFKAKKDKKHKCLTQTEGKIVSVNAMRINRRCAYFYTYEYEVNYEIITIEINFRTTYPQFREGDQVKIWYEKNNPKYSYIDGYKEDGVAAIVSCIAGTMLVIIGLFVVMFVWFY